MKLTKLMAALYLLWLFFLKGRLSEELDNAIFAIVAAGLALEVVFVIGIVVALRIGG